MDSDTGGISHGGIVLTHANGQKNTKGIGLSEFHPPPNTTHFSSCEIIHDNPSWSNSPLTSILG